MRLAFFILFSITVVISSCKKEKTNTISENPEISCVCLKENIGVTLGNQIECLGFLTMTTYTNATVGKVFSYMDATAYFNDKASTVNGNFVTVDSVLLNDRNFLLLNDANSKPMYYFTSLSATDPQRWRIYGANGIPTFEFSSNLKDPGADFSSVPSQINKSIQKSFKLNGVTNVTSAAVLILDESGKTSWNISTIIREGSNDICFPEDQLKLLGPGKARLVILLENTIVQPFNSKNIAFLKKLQYEKEIVLNP